MIVEAMRNVSLLSFYTCASDLSGDIFTLSVYHICGKYEYYRTICMQMDDLRNHAYIPIYALSCLISSSTRCNLLHSRHLSIHHLPSCHLSAHHLHSRHLSAHHLHSCHLSTHHLHSCHLVSYLQTDSCSYLRL